MRLIDSLEKVYDKSYSKFITQHKDCCEILESDKNATFCKLSVVNKGTVLSVCDSKMIQGQQNITENISSILKDSNCDGVVFLHKDGDEERNEEHLVFAELKSTYACDKLQKAFEQLIHSLLKYHRLLSLLEGYTLSSLTIDFVMACHAPSREQEAECSLDVVAAQELSPSNKDLSFASDLLPTLEAAATKKVTFSLNELSAMAEYPFNLDIMSKMINLHLITSQTPVSDEARIVLNY